MPSWLNKVSSPHPPSVSGNATTDDIRRFICPCLACGEKQVEPGDGHQYALVASEIAREASMELRHFFQLYENHDWAALNHIQKFDGTVNAALIYAVQCNCGLTMLAVRSPAELYDSDSLLDARVVGESEATVIKALPLTFTSI